MDKPIRDIVIRTDNLLWLVEEATSLDEAECAITMARVSGSVGATSVRKDGDTGAVTSFAKVARIEKVKPHNYGR